MAIIHPHLDENGDQVKIHDPHKPTGEDTWKDPRSVATFVPGGDSPFEHQEYQPPEVNDKIEKPFKQHPGLRTAAGVVIQEPDGRVWLHSPTNGFGGLKNSFPKGRHEGGHYQHTAAREAYEETGLNVRITGHVGDYDRSVTRTRYYTADRVGGNPAAMGWESQAMHLVPVDQLHLHLSHPTDLQIAKDLQQRHAIKKVAQNLK
jgi:8-oxo-dGTP pyrophosphatase MutT (NUDIX family)